jgi:S-adenosylmethionine-dependent methyltransferase
MRHHHRVDTRTTFDQQLTRWQAWCEAPWGRLRFRVVRETLGRQVEALGGGPLRVLDVGGGDGRDAIPLAEAGHEVTILDPAPSWLAQARRRADATGVSDRLRTVEGSVADLTGAGEDFDLVLCHFVLHYRPAGVGDVRRLADVIRPGGRVSVMAPNAATRVVMRLTREGPEAALEELGSEGFDSATFSTTARKLSAEEVTEELVDAGLVPTARYAARVVSDYVADDAIKEEPAYFEALERLELALCDQEPYVRLGAMWQVVGEKPRG